jgi:hypothetical protein
MHTNKDCVQLRAIYSEGVLKLIDDLELPEGTQVRVSIQSLETPAHLGVKLTYPTRLVPGRSFEQFGRLDRSRR